VRRANRGRANEGPRPQARHHLDGGVRRGQDEHGKRRQRSKGGFATKRDAQRFLTDTLSRLGDGAYAAPSKVTVAEYLTAEWLPAVEATLRPLSYTQ
jgi:hypothetical protein